MPGIARRILFSVSLFWACDSSRDGGREGEADTIVFTDAPRAQEAVLRSPPRAFDDESLSHSPGPAGSLNFKISLFSFCGALAFISPLRADDCAWMSNRNDEAGNCFSRAAAVWLRFFLFLARRRVCFFAPVYTRGLYERLVWRKEVLVYGSLVTVCRLLYNLFWGSRF